MNINIRKSGVIEAPPRGSFAGSIIILLVIGIASAAPFLLQVGGVYAVALLFVLLTAAIIKRQVYAVHLAILFFLLFVSAQSGNFFRSWPFKTLTPLLIYMLIVIAVPRLRESTGWLKKGELDAKVIRLVAATAILSAVALIGWVLLIRPDIQHHIDNIPDLPLWAYPVVGAGFAVLNASMEEAFFRGVVMEATDSAAGPGIWSVVLQAVPFAAFHYQAGFPNGVSGLVMTFVYGLMLGALRFVSRGMLAPVLAHIFADSTIFSILVLYKFD